MAINYEYLNKRRAEKAQQQTASTLPKLGNRFDGNLDPNTSEGLYNLAMMQGGRAAEVISEMAHPQKSLLSQIGNRVKNLAGDVVDVLSTSNEAVAGVILSMQGNGLTLGQNVRKAIKEDISASDALLGEYNGKNKSTANKIGNFVVRTGVDILLDPLTYLYGPGKAGIMGFKSLKAIEATAETAAKLGVKKGAKLFLNETTGKDLLTVTQKTLRGEFDDVYKASLSSLEKAGLSADDISKATKEATKDFEKALDSKVLSFDESQASLNRLLQIMPGLAETVLDKGGLKFAGSTILEGKKIQMIKDYIPLYKTADKAVQPIRDALGSIFNRRVQSIGNGNYKVISQQALDIVDNFNRVNTDKAIELTNKLATGLNALGIKTEDQLQTVMRHAMDKTNPVPEELSKAVKFVRGLEDEDIFAANAVGLNVYNMANYMPKLISKVDSNPEVLKSYVHPLSEAFTSGNQKKAVIFEDVASGSTIEGVASKLEDGGDIIKTKDGKTLKAVSSGNELKAIRDEAKAAADDVNKEILERTANIAEKQATLVDKYKSNVSKKISEGLKDKGIKNASKYSKYLSDKVNDLDINNIVSKRLENAYKNGIKIKLPKDEREKLIKQLELSGAEANTINDIIKEIANKEKRVVSSSKKKIEEKVITKSDDAFKALTQAVDENELNKIAKQISDEMVAGNGSKRASDTIIREQQEIRELLEQVNDINRSTLLQSNKVIEASEKATKQYVDKLDSYLADAADESLPQSMRDIAQGNADNMREQIYKLKNGEYNDLFVDESGNYLMRRSAKLDEALHMNGWSNLEDGINGTDFAKSFTYNINNSMNQMSSIEFVKSMTSMGTPYDVAPSGFRKLNIDKKFTNSAGKEVWFHPDVADMLEDVHLLLSKPQKDSGPLLQAFDKVQNLWKSSVTNLFAAFHMRNGVSNVLLSSMDIGIQSLNPKTWATSISIKTTGRKIESLTKKIYESEALQDLELYNKLIGEREELLNRVVWTSKTSGTKQSWTMGEMYRTMKANNIAFGQTSGSTAVDQVVKKKKELSELVGKNQPKNFLKRQLSNDNFLFTGGREVGSAIEENSKMIHFLTQLDKTGDVGLASAKTRQFLFDYTNLTDIEKSTLKRLIPFYSFTKFNLELQAKTIMNTPGISAIQGKAMKTFTDVFSQDDLTDEEKESIPSWMKRGFYYYKKKKDGTLQSVSIGESPLQQPEQALSAKGILGSISPLVRGPIEQLSGYDFYQGKAFSEATNAAGYKFAPKFIKDFIGYYSYPYTDANGNEQTWEVALRPSRLNLVNNLPPTSRVFGSLRTLSDSRKSDDQIAKSLIFGTYYQDVDIEKIMKREEEDTKKLYEEKLRAANLIGTFEKNYVRK